MTDEYQRALARRTVQKLFDRSPSFRPSIFASGWFIPPSLSFSSLSGKSFQSQNLNIPYPTHVFSNPSSDEIFGLVEEWCPICNKLKEVEIRYGKDGKVESYLGHEACRNTAKREYKNVKSVQAQPEIENKSDKILQRDLSISFLKSRIKNWTSDRHAVLVFPLGTEVYEITICMEEDISKRVTIIPSQESTIELRQTELNKYKWLEEALHYGWRPLLDKEVDSLLELTPDKTWFYLRLLKDGLENYFFIMLFNEYVLNSPIMIDSDE